MAIRGTERGAVDLAEGAAFGMRFEAEGVDEGFRRESLRHGSFSLRNYENLSRP